MDSNKQRRKSTKVNYSLVWMIIEITLQLITWYQTSQLDPAILINLAKLIMELVRKRQ
jgi:hypothetical protein